MNDIKARNDEGRDHIEVRLHNDGTVDEVLLYDRNGSGCIFHLEQMADHWFWMRFYGITQDLVVHLGANIDLCDGKPKPKIQTSFEWDDAAIESETQVQTPQAERYTEISQTLNKYGIGSVLQDIIDIYKKGRMAEHEQILIKDLTDAKKNYLEGDNKYWAELLAEEAC